MRFINYTYIINNFTVSCTANDNARLQSADTSSRPTPYSMVVDELINPLYLWILFVFKRTLSSRIYTVIFLVSKRMSTVLALDLIGRRLSYFLYPSLVFPVLNNPAILIDTCIMIINNMSNSSHFWWQENILPPYSEDTVPVRKYPFASWGPCLPCWDSAPAIRREPHCWRPRSPSTWSSGSCTRWSPKRTSGESSPYRHRQKTTNKKKKKKWKLIRKPAKHTCRRRQYKFCEHDTDAISYYYHHITEIVSSVVVPQSRFQKYPDPVTRPRRYPIQPERRVEWNARDFFIFCLFDDTISSERVQFFYMYFIVYYYH